MFGKNHPAYRYWLGKKRPEETNRKISLANKGKPSPFKGKTRSEEIRKKISEAIKKTYKLGRKSWNKGIKGSIPSITGEKNHKWKGGKYKTTEGYVLIYAPNHPFQNCRKGVREHRLIMEKHLERYLAPQEQVHHINGIKDDNRIENLKLFKNKSEHTKIHHPKGISINPSTQFKKKF